MTDGPQAFPPPGAPPPEQPAPAPQAHPAPGWTPAPEPVPAGWAPYPTAGPGPRPGLALGAAHKPGAFPLRPLGLGDLYDGAFRIIRFNPKATVGAAVLVTAAAMVIPIIVTAALTFTIGLSVDASGEIDPDASVADALAALAAFGSLGFSYLLSFVGIALVTGMVVHVTRAAAVGRRLDLSEAWTATRGKRWRLVGLVVLSMLAYTILTVVYVALWVLLIAASDNAWIVVVWGLVTVPAFVAACVWLWIKAYYLAVPALMLEDIGMFGAVGRAWSLTTRHFWRTFGIALLTAVIGTIGGSMLATPFSFAGQIGIVLAPEYGLLLLVLTQAVGLVVQNAFSAPFLASVTSMQYLDLRMRKEALDVELLREAGIISA